MAGFKTHISTSMTVGAGYTAAGCYYGLPIESCIVAGGICGLAGILPDLDSDTGVPVRETIMFSAAVIPMLMMDRFERLGLSHEGHVLATVAIYLIVRFGVAQLFKRYTVHRGMWHSLPAAATVGFLAFLICSGENEVIRIFKSFAAVLGFMTHLILDEIWSIELGKGGVRLKKSSGTAMKLWGNSRWANISTYAKLLFFGSLALSDPVLMEHFGLQDNHVPEMARTIVDEVVRQGQSLLR